MAKEWTQVQHLNLARDDVDVRRAGELARVSGAVDATALRVNGAARGGVPRNDFGDVDTVLPSDVESRESENGRCCCGFSELQLEPQPPLCGRWQVSKGTPV